MKFLYITAILFFISCMVSAQHLQRYTLQVPFPHFSFDNPVDLRHAVTGADVNT